MLRHIIALVFMLQVVACIQMNARELPVPSDSVVHQINWNDRDSIVSFGKRFSFHTNVIDWAIAMPNIGVEFDLSGRETSRYSLGIHAKYRPALFNKVAPRFVFNVFQLRGEFRRYWRTFVYEDYDRIKERKKYPGKVKTIKDSTQVIIHKYFMGEVVDGGDSAIVLNTNRFVVDSIKEPFFTYFYRRYLSGAQSSYARNWRAYYVGVYAEIDKFTYNINSNGRQGTGGGFGITAGYTLPLYPMKNGASIDLDLGISIGARIHEYEKFTYEEETHCYAYTGRQERSFVKYPVLADAHVSIVYRFNSIKNKVKGCEERFASRFERYSDRLIEKGDTLDRVATRKSDASIENIKKKNAQRIKDLENARVVKTLISHPQTSSGDEPNDSLSTKQKSDKKAARAAKAAQKAAAKAAKQQAKAAAAEEKRRAKEEKDKQKGGKK